MNASDATLDLATVVVMLVAAVSWAVSLAGIYFSLRGQINAIHARNDNLSKRLDEGSSKFTLLEANHTDHGGRLIYLETIVPLINEKLDKILIEMKSK